MVDLGRFASLVNKCIRLTELCFFCVQSVFLYKQDYFYKDVSTIFRFLFLF